MTYPTYPSPTFPPNSNYNPWRSYEQAAANAEATPQPKAVHGLWTGRYGFVFTIVTICVTVVALVVAVLGSSLASRTASTAGSGLAPVFNGAFTNDGQWDNTGACYFSSSSLDVTTGNGSGQCEYKPSVNSDFTSQGYLLEVTVAPAASIQGQEIVVLSAGGTLVEVTQTGSFAVCQAQQLPCTIGTPSSTGDTDAWHTDAYVSNTIALRYDPGAAQVTVAVNGQQITSQSVSQVSGPIGLGAGLGGEAVYTSASLYSASGAQGS